MPPHTTRHAVSFFGRTLSLSIGLSLSYHLPGIIILLYLTFHSAVGPARSTTHYHRPPYRYVAHSLFHLLKKHYSLLLHPPNRRDSCWVTLLIPWHNNTSPQLPIISNYPHRFAVVASAVNVHGRDDSYSPPQHHQKHSILLMYSDITAVGVCYCC